VYKRGLFVIQPVFLAALLLDGAYVVMNFR
jgi:hypothetical protein